MAAMIEDKKESLPEEGTIMMDGVHEYVDIDTLEEILVREISGEKKCQAILEKALGNGSSDDISVVIIDSLE